VRIKLQEHPFAVLLILLEKHGQLVTKEELQQRLWSADTFVEFDKGIYNAMNRLRETLGDEAKTPRYIPRLPLYCTRG
jgi:DNA-binding winged helix-turn-helix (wHTH) protein